VLATAQEPPQGAEEVKRHFVSTALLICPSFANFEWSQASEAEPPKPKPKPKAKVGCLANLKSILYTWADQCFLECALVAT